MPQKGLCRQPGFADSVGPLCVAHFVARLAPRDKMPAASTLKEPAQEGGRCGTLPGGPQNVPNSRSRAGHRALQGAAQRPSLRASQRPA